MWTRDFVAFLKLRFQIYPARCEQGMNKKQKPYVLIVHNKYVFIQKRSNCTLIRKMFYDMLCGKIAKHFCLKTFIPPVTGDNNTGVGAILNFLAHVDTKTVP